MLKEGYTMISRAIFGKVHGHGVQEIWLISQFPAKHTGVDLGYGTSWSYKQWVHHLYSLLAPKWLHFAFQRPISYFLTLWNHNLCSWCNTGGEVSLQAESWKTPTLKPLRSKDFWLSGKKRSLKYQNKISFQISLCDRSKIIVNQTEWKFTQRAGRGNS